MGAGYILCIGGVCRVAVLPGGGEAALPCGGGAYSAAERDKMDDAIHESGAIRRIIYIVPLLLLRSLLTDYFGIDELTGMIIDKILTLSLVLVLAWSVSGVLRAVRNVYDLLPFSKDRPIKGTIQIINLFVAIGAVLWMITVIFDISPGAVIGSFGALSAVILLIFRDTILGFTAGIQLSANNLVRLGDWIQIDSSKVDGEIVDINLQTIRVRNWDNTIVSVPIYQLISQSFINWRGMQESGGRRIKRAIYIDMQSVRFCTPEDIGRFRGCALIQEYIDKKVSDIAQSNEARGVDSAVDAGSARVLTNLGTFRAYVVAYLREHPLINNNLTMMTRQLGPSENGLPLEVYAFSSEKEWVAYEGVQADIFDHLLAILPFFGLRVFQRTSDMTFLPHNAHNDSAG